MMTKSQMKTVALSALSVVYVLFLLLFIPRLQRWFISFATENHLMDETGAYICKAVLFAFLQFSVILLICKLSGMERKDFGLTFGNSKRGIFWVLIITIKCFVAFLLRWLIAHNLDYPYTGIPQFTGKLMFELPNAIMEELEYRSVIMTLLIGVFCGHPFTRIQDAGNGRKIAALLTSSLMFGLAHTGITIFPFSINWSPLWVLNSSVSAIWFGICYLRSGSVYWCGIAHCLSNMTGGFLTTLLISVGLVTI